MRGSVTKSWRSGNQIVREGRFAAAGRMVCCFAGHSVQSAAMLSSSSSAPESISAVTQQRATGFSLPRDITAAERRTLVAGGLGWMLDAMDVMLFSLVIAYLLREFSMDTRTAGFLNSMTLIASAIGGQEGPPQRWLHREPASPQPSGLAKLDAATTEPGSAPEPPARAKSAASTG